MTQGDEACDRFLRNREPRVTVDRRAEATARLQPTWDRPKPVAPPIAVPGRQLRERDREVAAWARSDVGRTGSVREGAALAIDIDRTPDRYVVTLRGELCMRTAGLAATALSKVLGDGRAVLVDLAGMQVRWVPALHMFPATFAAAGGWPAVRMVLFCADPDLAAALHRVGVPMTVPLEPTFKSAVQRLAIRPARVARCHELRVDVGSPRRARALVRSACNDWGITGIASEAALVATELVANAVEHAGTACRLRIGLDERGLHLAVRDQRPDRLPRRPPDEPSQSTAHHPGQRGYGLQIIAATCARWGVTTHPDGKTVWAILTSATRAPS
jgi:anti-sigma regulatory factor (Ser/Thr protein kinase)